MALTTVGLQLTGKGPAEDAGEEERLLSGFDEESSGNLSRIQVSVTGMTCAACSNSVESALMTLNGVVKASVALLQNKADVTFDPALLKVRSSSSFVFSLSSSNTLYVNMHVDTLHI